MRDPITCTLERATDGSPGLGVSGRLARGAALEPVRQPPRESATSAAGVEDPERLAERVGSATVGPDPMTLGSSPTTSEIAERDSPPGARRGQAAAFHAGEVLAHAVDGVDVGIGAQQAPRDLALGLERHARRGHGHEGRRAAREQHDQALVGADAARDLEGRAARAGRCVRRARDVPPRRA